MYDEVIIENTNLVYHILKKMKLYEQRDEYFDLGMIGLIKGVKTYNSKQHTALSTYLARCITNEILQYQRSQKAEKRNKGIKPLSLEQVLYIDDCKEITLADVIASDKSIEEEIIKKQLIEEIHKEINNLSERDRFILCSYFGIFGIDKLNQFQLAEKFNLSQAQISRILKSILKNIREKVGEII